MSLHSGIILLAILAGALAYSGQYVPKSFYTIDSHGHKSDVVYIRNRRDIMEGYGRFKRAPAPYASSSSSSSSASSSSYSSSSSGGGAPIYYDNNNFAGQGFAPGYPASGYASVNTPEGSYQNLNPGPALVSRFGENYNGQGQVSAASSGQQGSYSASSTSVDNTGKVTYSAQSGKY